MTHSVNEERSKPTRTNPRVPSGGNAVDVLQGAGLWPAEGPLRLHLGCGEVHLDGYINIDYPPAEHTVQKTVAADVHANISELLFPRECIDEVRLHYVFEHFDRPTALGLLGRWHLWLKVGGEIVIETPDVDACIQLLRSRRHSYRQKQVVLRHLFGSHEATWAVHWDGWYEEKYRRVLTELGYSGLRFERSAWGMTRNLTVRARKQDARSETVLASRACSILRHSLVDESASEEELWRLWCGRVRALLAPPAPPSLEQRRVTVFVPVYNREEYLPQTLDSLLAQTFRTFEVLIADDGSTDGTLRIAREYAARDPRIRVLPLPHSGEVAARNAAVAAADPRSQYLMNHDSDDLSDPEKLEKLVAYLDDHPEVAIVGCRAEYFDDAGNRLGHPAQELDSARVRETFGEHNSLVNSAALIRREVFERVGRYRQEFAGVDDYDFFARALRAGLTVVNLPEVLHRIRLHPGSISVTRSRRTRLLVERIRSEYRYHRRREQTSGLRRAGLWLRCQLRKHLATLRYAREGVVAFARPPFRERS